MSEYWFVVKPANEMMFEALQKVLMGRPGCHIIKDRRVQEGRPPRGGERRTALVWESTDISIAERDTAGWPDRWKVRVS